MRWLVVLAIALSASVAGARTATGYTNGEKVKLKVVPVGGAEAEVHTAIAFRAMARAASKAGIDLRIRSGFRTYAKQKALYREYRKGEGNLAARPGFSNHESGRALDLYITNYKVYEWLEGHAARYGFHRTVPGEPWHWEYLGGYEPERKVSARHGRSSSRS
ncbi:MAG TPA: D-alanyl-D-alanine carboxypeptidase family protein [Kofleriaceae bacterium]|nr:D-alanyl-D-alanine carboxypeptidase family protein [Kofleriaceae bacterium]